MTIPNTIHFRDPQWWSAEQTTCVRGSAFDGSALLDSRELAVRFSAVANRDEFVALLEHLNGFFAVIQLVGNEYRLGVDRVRSIPLFYGISGKSVWVSGDCHWVAEQSGNEPWGDVFVAEFYHAGYVTDRDTLVPNVKQCMAGEAVFLNIENDSVVQSPHRYFRYGHRQPEQHDDNLLHKQHEHVLDEEFQRLIAFANGRPIVIPLSGGYDSRLIALMLKIMDYPNVTCFSYGRPGNREAIVSKQVADALGFTWKFVPYSDELSADFFHSDKRTAYERYSGTLCSLPHMQDWLAIQHLLAEGHISSDSVVVPGHTGDLLGGGRSSSFPQLYRDKPLNINQVIDGSLELHYDLWPLEKSPKEIQVALHDRLYWQIENIADDHAINNASIFETWNVENRQAKYIINSVRVYDFFKLDWWLPLWDSGYMNFWASVPLELRRNKRWYNSFVDALYRRIVGKTDLPATEVVTIYRNISLLLRRFPLLRKVAHRILPKRGQSFAQVYNDPAYALGFISEEQLRSIWTGKESRLSLRTAATLGKIVIKDPRM